MSYRALCLPVIFCSVWVFGQNNSPAPVPTPAVYYWTTGATGSEATDVQGSHILMQKSTNGEVAVSIRQVGQYIRAYVQLLNFDKDPVSFDPMKATLLMTSPKEKVYEALDPEKAAKGIESDSEDAARTPTDAGCAMMIAQCQPTDSAMNMGKDTRAMGAQEAALARKDGMKPVTLNQNQDGQGAIYFKPDRKRKDVVIRIPFGGGIYEFPFTLGKK